MCILDDPLALLFSSILLLVFKHLIFLVPRIFGLGPLSAHGQWTILISAQEEDKNQRRANLKPYTPHLETNEQSPFEKNVLASGQLSSNQPKLEPHV